MAQFRRGPGLPSSLLGLEISMGLDTKIDYADVMNRKEHSEIPVDFHRELEKRMDGM